MRCECSCGILDLFTWEPGLRLSAGSKGWTVNSLSLYGSGPGQVNSAGRAGRHGKRPRAETELAPRRRLSPGPRPGWVPGPGPDLSGGVLVPGSEVRGGGLGPITAPIGSGILAEYASLMVGPKAARDGSNPNQPPNFRRFRFAERAVRSLRSRGICRTDRR